MISEAQAHLKLGGLRVGPAGEPFVVGHEPTESEVNTQYVTEHSLDHAVFHWAFSGPTLTGHVNHNHIILVLIHTELGPPYIHTTATIL